MIGDFWCGPSFFVVKEGSPPKDAKDVARVVSSGGQQVQTWKVDASKSPALRMDASVSIDAPHPDGQDGGFFTSISSNGTDPNTAVIWAVGKPTGMDNHVTLHAFDAATLKPLLPGGLIAGNWPNTGGNANIVPTVANGKVYVASNKQLQIFGFGSPGPFISEPASGASAIAGTESLGTLPVPPSSPMYWGILKRINGNLLLVQLRTGRVLDVDVTEAVKKQQAAPVNVGQAVAVGGIMNANGVFEANILLRAKGRSTWGEDIPQQ
jgi:hypothetical protein